MGGVKRWRTVTVACFLRAERLVAAVTTLAAAWPTSQPVRSPRPSPSAIVRQFVQQIEVIPASGVFIVPSINSIINVKARISIELI
jgi:hypothetical protein